MRDLVFVPIIVFAFTAMCTAVVCLVIELRERKRMTRQTQRLGRRRVFRPVVIHNDAGRRRDEGLVRADGAHLVGDAPREMSGASAQANKFLRTVLT